MLAAAGLTSPEKPDGPYGVQAALAASRASSSHGGGCGLLCHIGHAAHAAVHGLEAGGKAAASGAKTVGAAVRAAAGSCFSAATQVGYDLGKLSPSIAAGTVFTIAVVGAPEITIPTVIVALGEGEGTALALGGPEDVGWGSQQDAAVSLYEDAPEAIAKC